MRPLALEIEGLTAFRHQQTADLSDLDLFVITGPTGAGKSSILDAITFALFGKVCRVGRKSELRDIISHGSPAVKVQLDFEVDGEPYRVVRRLPRKGGQQAHLDRLDNGEVVVDTPGTSAVNRRIEELLGLDFEAFTKAVLLPQGRFHDFLTGDPDGRRKILTGLLELDRYLEMGTRARERARMITGRLEALNTRLTEDFADATPDNLRLAQEAARKAATAACEKRKAADRARDLAQSIAVHARVADELQKSVDAIQELDHELENIEPRIEAIRRQLESSETALTQAEEAVANSSAAKRMAEEALTGAGARLGNEAQIGRFLNAVETVEKESEALSGVEREAQEIESHLKKSQEHLEAVRSRQKQAARALEESQKEGEQLRVAFDLATRARQYSQLSDHLREAEREVDRTNAELEKAQRHRGKAKAALDHLQTRHLAESLQARLSIGARCPVCEQVVSALPEGRAQLSKALQDAATTLERAEKEHVEAQERAAHARSTRGSLLRELEEVGRTLPEEARGLDLAAASQRIAEAESALQGARDRHRSLMQEEEVADDELQEAGATRARAEERDRARHQQLDALRARIEDAQSVLRPVFGAELHPTEARRQLEDSLSTLTQARKNLDERSRAHEEARNLLDKTRSDRDGANTEQQRLMQMLAEARGRAQGQARQLAQVAEMAPGELPDAGERSPSVQVSRLRAYCLSLAAAAEQRRRESACALDQTVAKLRELAESAGLRAEGPPADILVRELIEDASAAEGKRDSCARMAADLEKRVERRREIEQSVAMDRKEKGLHQKLAAHLQSNHFIAYVLGESMRTLAALATSELKKLSDGRYSIEPRESSFRVVDHANADETRSVATLSGGETFLASLALALALAGSVRDLAGNAAAARLDSMFIDEGFGALDADTLEIAVDALERLSAGNRMIGVISHVPALADRFPSGLDVHKVGVSSTVSRRDRAPALQA